VYEVNFGRVSALREKKKAEFEAAGAKLTYTAFIAKGFYFGIAVAAYSISWIWASNVKKISVSTASETHVYCLGATVGSLCGCFISGFVFRFFA
jgi:hypothetical protein